jgi:hypothetical protein
MRRGNECEAGIGWRTAPARAGASLAEWSPAADD